MTRIVPAAQKIMGHPLALSPAIQPGAIIRGYSFKTEREDAKKVLTINKTKIRPYFVWGIGQPENEKAPIIFAFSKTTNTRRSHLSSQFNIAAGEHGFGHEQNDKDAILNCTQLSMLPVTSQYFPSRRNNGTIPVCNTPDEISEQTWKDIISCRAHALLWEAKAELVKDIAKLPRLTSYEGMQLPLSFSARGMLGTTVFRDTGYRFDPAPDIYGAPNEPREKITWLGHGISDNAMRDLILDAYYDAASDRIKNAALRHRIAEHYLFPEITDLEPKNQQHSPSP